MVCRPFTSRDHSPPIRFLRFWLELKCLPIPEWFYSTPRVWHRCCDGLRVLAGCSQTYNKTLPVLGNNGLPFSHLNGSFPTIRPLSFWLELKCLIIPEWFYITPSLWHRCCDGLRVLAGCSHTYNKILSVLGNNGLPFSHLNGSFPPLSDPSDFGLSWNADQFLSGSIAHPVMTQVLW